MGRDGLISGEEVIYVYPDWMTAIKVGPTQNTSAARFTFCTLQGCFKSEKLIAGVKVRVCKASLTRGSFLHLEVCSLKDWGDIHYFRYRESTTHQMAEHPLIPDIYESKTVSVKRSR